MSSRTRHPWMSALAIAVGVLATALTTLPATTTAADNRGGQNDRDRRENGSQRGWNRDNRPAERRSIDRDNGSNRRDVRRDNARLDRGDAQPRRDTPANNRGALAGGNRPNNGADNRRGGASDGRRILARDNRENRPTPERARGDTVPRFNSAPNSSRAVREGWSPATGNGWNRDNRPAERRDTGRVDRGDRGRSVREYRTLPRRDSRGYVLDRRYHHNHYYPPRGHVLTVAPRGAVIIRHGGVPYHYYHGSWYRPYGPRFVVVAPPIGLFVSTLPPFYSTVWWHGVPYYYADNVYYTWRPERRSYVVTDPPEGAPLDEDYDDEDPAPLADDLYIYPKNGQSEEQQAEDRYECHEWASGQTGYDPTQPLGGVSESETEAKRDDYYRAMTACLEGRGYSVK